MTRSSSLVRALIIGVALIAGTPAVHAQAEDPVSFAKRYYQSINDRDLATAVTFWEASAANLAERITSAMTPPRVNVVGGAVTEYEAGHYAVMLLLREIDNPSKERRHILRFRQREDGTYRMVAEQTSSGRVAERIIHAKTFDEAVAIVHEAPDSFNEILWSLVSIATYHRGVGEYRRYQELMSRAEMLTEHFDPSPKPRRYIYQQAGTGFVDLGQLDKGAECFNLSIGLIEDHASKDMWEEYYGLFRVFRARSMPDQARECALLVLDASDQDRWHGPRIAMQALNGLGGLELDQGNFAAARGYYQQAREINRHAKAERWEALLLTNLGNVEAQTGDLTAALSLRTEALALARLNNARPSMIQSLLELSNLHRRRGELAVSEERAKEALSIAQEAGNHHLAGFAHLSIATTAVRLGNLTAAESSIEAAHRTWSGKMDVPARIRYHSVRQDLSMARRDYEAARRDAEVMLDAFVPRRSDDQIVEQLVLLAEIATTNSEWDEAIRLASFAASAAETIGVWNPHWRAEYAQAIAYRGAGNEDEALRHLECAMEVLERTRSTLENADAVQHFVEDKLEPYRLAVEMELDRGAVERALTFAERSRAAGLMHTTTALNRAAERARDTDAGTSAQRLLADHCSVIEFVFSPTRLTAFVVSKKGTAVHRYDLDPLALVALIEKHHSDLASRSLGFRNSSRKLHEALIEPIAGLLGTCESLLILPDRQLWEVAFSALIDGKGKYLIDRYDLAYGRSMRSVVTAANRENVTELTAFANPTIPRLLADRIAPIPALEESARTIVNLYDRDQGTLHTRAAATESRLKQMATPRGLLHFGTHAEAVDGAPQHSFVVLASDDLEDGRLEAREVSQLKLHDTDLVMLAACETARSRAAAGEGLLGLTWAFQLAGARNVAATLWKVDATSTSTLAVGFYEAFRETGSVGASLRRSALSVRANPRYAHPFYWSGMIVIQ